MDGYRTPQETTALRDVAYVINFGHFPGDEEQGKDGVAATATETPGASSLCEDKDGDIPKKGSNDGKSQASGGDGNPFNEDNDSSNDDVKTLNDKNDGEDLNPFSDDGNPFNEDDAPSAGDTVQSNDMITPVTEDTNPFTEDCNSTTEDQDVATPQFQTTSKPVASSRVLQQSPASSFRHYPQAPHQHVEFTQVSRNLVREVVTEMFNVTQLDLRCLMEDVSRNKEIPTVQLLLEDLRTEGLGLQPTTGSCSPPLVFLRAAVGNSSSFTTFTSTSATRATQDALTMGVKNMYTETLLLQLWSVPVAEEVELTTAAPMMDKLTRLIKHAKDRTNNSSPYKIHKEVTPADNVMKLEATATAAGESKTDNSNDIRTISISKDAAPSEDSTEICTLPAEEESADNENRNQDKKSPTKSEASNTSNDQMPLESTITVGAEKEVVASTPRGKSASIQDLELSSLSNEGNQKPLQKSKSSMGSFKKVSNYSLRASFRSNFRKNKHNGSVVSSEQQVEKPFDTASMVSQDSVGNPFEEEMSSNSGLWHDEEDGGSHSNQLNREKSRSTLSVTSFTRLNLSFRLSSKKASQVLRRIGSKREKVSRSETSTPEPTRRLQYLPPSADTSPIAQPKSSEDDDTAHPVHSTPVSSAPGEDSLDFTPNMKKSIRSMFRPRALRTFSSLGNSSATGLAHPGENEGTVDDGEGGSSTHPQKALQNPKEIQDYLSSLGKAHLKAELLAYTSIPVKSLVGKWRKEGWLPLTQVQKESLATQKKKKSIRAGTDSSRDKAGCRFHICLTLPSPETELGTTGYDTYHTTLRKLVHAHLSTVHGSLSGYNGEVSPVGDVLLQQLMFFSRVAEPQKCLAKWLVLTEVKPGDPGILLPLLQAIKTHLEAGIYLTTQKRQLGVALVTWVRKVLSDEFEMLHSSFPRREGLLELARLENFLRCFNTVENCYELRVLFEREAAPHGHTAITDLLQDVLVKHADNWVEALSKERLQQDTGDTPTTPTSTSEDSAWVLWQDCLRRASLLTKPVLDFLTISFHTYQPIFMLELSVDYMYLVMPKMLKAAAHLLNPLIKFDVDGTAHHVTAKAKAVAAQATWVLITNLSNVNKIGISSRLPQHLILKTYCDAFSEVLHHWLVLSKHLALEEFQKDILEDQFVAVDPSLGHSQSAIGVADLMKAVMKRFCGVEWPGDVGPRATTLQTMGQQMMELAAQYAEKVTHAYISIATQTNNIPAEVCVVVRNVEHVCHEVRMHLLHLAEMAKEAPEVVQHLQDRTTHLQEHVEDSAEALLRQCLPNLEKTVRRAVQEGNSQHVVKTLEEAIQLVQDRLYFAEPLLHQMWYRIVDHVEQLKAFYVQGEHREYLRQLKVVLESCHDFLTDSDGIGLVQPEEVTKNYKSMQAELKLLGATSPELISQFYQIRYCDQQREDSTSEKVMVFNAMFTKSGLRVHVVQAPGVVSVASLVKVRLEPFQWFPTAEPLKTHHAKGNPAVFDEVLEFPGVLGDCKEGEGVLILQVRSPRLLSSSTVHGEIVLPLAELPSVSESEVFGVPHLRSPMTRPWDFKSYKPLEALMSRTHDKLAMEFMKTLSERWKSGESSEVISDNSKLLSTFARAGSVRSVRATGKKHPRKGSLVK